MTAMGSFSLFSLSADFLSQASLLIAGAYFSCQMGLLTLLCLTDLLLSVICSVQHAP